MDKRLSYCEYYRFSICAAALAICWKLVHQTNFPTYQAGEPRMMNCYHDVQAAKIWNQHRITRIVLHELLLKIYQNVRILDKVGNFFGLEIIQKRSIEIIISMSSEICASIPFHLRQMNPRWWQMQLGCAISRWCLYAHLATSNTGTLPLDLRRLAFHGEGDTQREKSRHWGSPSHP